MKHPDLSRVKVLFFSHSAGLVGNIVTSSRRKRRVARSLSPSTSLDLQPQPGVARPPTQTPNTCPVLHSFRWTLDESDAPQGPSEQRSGGQIPYRNLMKWELKPRSGSARCSPTLHLVQLQTENRPSFHGAPSVGSSTCIYILHIPFPGKTSRS